MILKARLRSISTLAPKILLFDSGVGGLSVFDEIVALLPQACYFYALDNAWAPYGERSEEALGPRILAILAEASQKKPDIIVIACNTASTFILPVLRQVISIPIVGVIPPIKPGALLSATKTLGLLATPATVKRPYIDQLLRDHAPGCTLVRVGSTALVKAAEAKLRGHQVDAALVAAEIAPLFATPGLDTILLGCTHFPHLLQELKSAAPRTVHWLDTGAAIARRVVTILADRGIADRSEPLDQNTVFFSQDDAAWQRLLPAFTARNFHVFQNLNLTIG